MSKVKVFIQYDDREKYPWLVWVGTILYARFLYREGAERTVARLERVIPEVLKNV